MTDSTWTQARVPGLKRALTAGWLLFSAIGVALVARDCGWISRGASEGSRPDPAWTVDAPRLDSFLHPVEQPDGPILDSEEALRRLGSLVRAERLRSFRTRASVLRVLRAGFVFDADAEFSYRSGSDGASTVDLHVTRGGREFLTCTVRLQDGKIVSIDSPEPLFRNLPVHATVSEVPLALGDASLDDMRACLKAIRLARLSFLGELTGMNAEHTLVFRLDLGSRGPAEDAWAGSVAGATALVHVAPDRETLRALRVFNASGRLVRVYDGFRDERLEDGTRQISLRIESLDQGSQTVLRLLDPRLELDEDPTGD